MAERSKTSPRGWSPRGKGILAADESTGTIKKRFDAIGLASTADSRRDYREMLFRTDEAMQHYISGVILYDETIRQKAKDGTPLVERHRGSRRRPRHQGRQRRQAAGALARREGHRGPRRAARAAQRVLRRSAPASPSGGRVIDIGRRHADRQLHQRQRPCAGALCGALPGGRHRADRRAGSADGRRRATHDIDTCYEVTEWC